MDNIEIFADNINRLFNKYMTFIPYHGGVNNSFNLVVSLNKILLYIELWRTADKHDIIKPSYSNNLVMGFSMTEGSNILKNIESNCMKLRIDACIYYIDNIHRGQSETICNKYKKYLYELSKVNEQIDFIRNNKNIKIDNIDNEYYKTIITDCIDIAITLKLLTDNIQHISLHELAQITINTIIDYQSKSNKRNRDDTQALPTFEDLYIMKSNNNKDAIYNRISLLFTFLKFLYNIIIESEDYLQRLLTSIKRNRESFGSIIEGN